jgi:ribonuclease HIII
MLIQFMLKKKELIHMLYPVCVVTPFITNVLIHGLKQASIVQFVLQNGFIKNNNILFYMEKQYYNQPNVIECGIDEAGRGPLLGNVYAAAVILDSMIEIPIDLIIDSKKLSKKKKKISF